jgi:hypothetical protein
MYIDVSSSDIYDNNQKKYDDVISILRMNMVNLDLDWFMYFCEVIAIRSVFDVL